MSSAYSPSRGLRACTGPLAKAAIVFFTINAVVILALFTLNVFDLAMNRAMSPGGGSSWADTSPEHPSWGWTMVVHGPLVEMEEGPLPYLSLLTVPFALPSLVIALGFFWVMKRHLAAQASLDPKRRLSLMLFPPAEVRQARLWLLLSLFPVFSATGLLLLGTPFINFLFD